jgi:CRISPR-associated endonuclease Csn1
VSAKSKEKKMDNLYNKLKEILPDISNDEILSDICKNITSSNNTHAFSLKALNEFIIDLYENENGQNQQNLRIRKESSVVTSDRKYLNPKLLSEEILSPTAKRSLWQAIKVLNKLIYFLSKEFEINMIAVEMTRDKNSAEEKKRIRQFQELNNRRNERIIDLIKNLSEDQRKKVAHKLWLAYSQD